jgi:pimeloyl-ACP methyl ester carboxylesterase
VQALQVTSTAAIRWTDVPGIEPALVIVPGLGASAVAHFLHVVTHPALLGRRALLVDLLGFGTSDRPTDFDYSLASHAASVAGVLRHVGLGPVDLVGHSLGGSIAIHLTHLAPDAVGRLVAIEPNLDPWDGTASVEIARQSETEFIDTGFAALLSSAGPSWRATLRLADPAALHRTAVGLCTGPDKPLRRTLLQARLPRTLVWGAQSPPPSGLEELRASGVAYAEIPAAGHVPMEDAPDTLAQTLAAVVPTP